MPKDSKGHGSNKRFDNSGPRYQKQVDKKAAELPMLREKVKAAQASGDVQKYLVANDKKKEVVRREIAGRNRVNDLHSNANKRRKGMSK